MISVLRKKIINYLKIVRVTPNDVSQESSPEHIRPFTIGSALSRTTANRLGYNFGMYFLKLVT